MQQRPQPRWAAAAHHVMDSGAVAMVRRGVATWLIEHDYTSARGVLRGQGALAGARLTVERDGPAWQVGPGASGRNAPARGVRIEP